MDINKSDQVHIYHSRYISISLVLFNIHKEFVLISPYLLCTITWHEGLGCLDVLSKIDRSLNLVWIWNMHTGLNGQTCLELSNTFHSHLTRSTQWSMFAEHLLWERRSLSWLLLPNAVSSNISGKSPILGTFLAIFGEKKKKKNSATVKERHGLTNQWLEWHAENWLLLLRRVILSSTILQSTTPTTGQYPIGISNSYERYLDKMYARTVGTTAILVEAAAIWSYEGMIGGL